MASIAILLAGLALACAQKAPDAPKLTATIQDAPPEGKRKTAAFLVEGTTDLGDGARIDVELYFGHATGLKMAHTACPVRDGKFSVPVEIKWIKNIPGTYFFRIDFNPHLQPDALSRIQKKQVDISFQIGTELEAQAVRREYRDRLLREVKASVAVVEEVQALLDRTRKKPDPDAWKSRQKEWHERLLEIHRRSDDTFEYMVFPELRAIATDQMEFLHIYLRQLTRIAPEGRPEELQKGREKIEHLAAGLIQALTRSEYTPAEVLSLAREIRKQLKAAAALPAEELAEARSRIKLALITLGGAAPASARDSGLAVLAASVPYLKALEEKAPQAAKLLEDLDQKMEAFLEDLEPEKK